MAGAYCQFCDQRCFVLRTLPDGSWTGHMATCVAGAAHDRQRTGYDYTTAVNAALVRCEDCDRPVSEWPSSTCDRPSDHTTATYDCPCGDVITVADVQAAPAKHRRCHLIGASS